MTDLETRARAMVEELRQVADAGVDDPLWETLLDAREVIEELLAERATLRDENEEMVSQLHHASQGQA
jgi:hypothetical protein